MEQIPLQSIILLRTLSLGKVANLEEIYSNLGHDVIAHRLQRLQEADLIKGIHFSFYDGKKRANCYDVVDLSITEKGRRYLIDNNLI